jgi:hypothetical protein
MLRIRKIFEEEMELGLNPNPSKKSSLQMANTYIPQLPNGKGNIMDSHSTATDCVSFARSNQNIKYHELL